MSTPTLDLIQEMFLRYYTECSGEIGVPRGLVKREIGVVLFRDRIMVRHRTLRTIDELKDFLRSTNPSDVYYSSAYYEQPDAPEMNAKAWMGADLIFDIDADHVPTSCEKIHDTWQCVNCGFAGRGLVPEACPVCRGSKFLEKNWVCDTCLESAKSETAKLVEVLMRDFGFSEKDLHAYFSGHRGYHVHVEEESIRALDAVARREIVDYLSGMGLDIRFHGVEERNLEGSNVFIGPCLNDLGWRGRIARGAFSFLQAAGQEDLANMDLDRKVVNALLKKKEKIIENWKEGHLSRVKGLGFETWRKLFERSSSLQSVCVDTVVTPDVHRLIRMAGTLHGKTGLKKVEFPISKLEEFDPLRDAVAFKSGAMFVSVSEAPRFRMGEEVFGPYKEETINLPTAAAMFLLCNSVAKVAD